MQMVLTLVKPECKAEFFRNNFFVISDADY